MTTITINHKVGNNTEILEYAEPIAPETFFGIGKLIQSLYNDPLVEIDGNLDGVSSAIDRDGIFDEEDGSPIYDSYSFVKGDGYESDIETWTFRASEVAFFL